ncbi:hypothetical protein CDV31_015601 [Fusarium ambrosium]|uniref:Uncharacterized protein n=1 Tax=Fusarium ambrosium TaxID=131363 RepID=A0A428SM97_9HYPO|nr:hypothetical protein CDV31_015601 [Fusarium ambrosium]
MPRFVENNLESTPPSVELLIYAGVDGTDGSDPYTGAAKASRTNTTEQQQQQQQQPATLRPPTQPDKWNALFSEFLGICIAPAASPYHEGTKGLYLRIRGTKRMLLLTCRHVAFTEREANEDFRHSSAADPKKIIQLGTGTLAKARESVNEDIKRSERIMEKNKDLPWASAVRKLNEAMAEKAAEEELL